MTDKPCANPACDNEGTFGVGLEDGGHGVLCRSCYEEDKRQLEVWLENATLAEKQAYLARLMSAAGL